MIAPLRMDEGACRGIGHASEVQHAEGLPCLDSRKIVLALMPTKALTCRLTPPFHSKHKVWGVGQEVAYRAPPGTFASCCRATSRMWAAREKTPGLSWAGLRSAPRRDVEPGAGCWGRSTGVASSIVSTACASPPSNPKFDPQQCKL